MQVNPQILGFSKVVTLTTTLNHITCINTFGQGFKKTRYSPSMLSLLKIRGWSGGAMVLGKLPVPASYNLDESRARAYCACSRCGWGLI